ncbi:hypothetical protein [Nevskia ramosa]|uniref:hypothetical protein n=1 Tax=Nevskia ramosa TaxID=64002 RepID=UPI003D0F5B93
MIILESFESIEVAVPKAVNALQNLEGVALFHELRGSRHPLGAYNISLAAVARRFVSVLNELHRAKTQGRYLDPKEYRWDIELLEATDHLLDSLMEHLEDCSGIFESFFENDKDNTLKRIKLDFLSSIKPYRTHIGTVVNYMKHHQGRLRSVTFSWAGGGSIGYFVEGPIAGGAVGPTKKIHPSEATAFSFNRNIPYHLCSVFAVGSRLASALHDIDRRIIGTSARKYTEMSDGEWGSALRQTADLSRDFFPDEVALDVPAVEAWRNGIKIQFPGSRRGVRGPHGTARISCSFAGDGATNNFRAPYFNAKS